MVVKEGLFLGYCGLLFWRSLFIEKKYVFAVPRVAGDRMEANLKNKSFCFVFVFGLAWKEMNCRAYDNKELPIQGIKNVFLCNL